jgi:hypothetical protein
MLSIKLFQLVFCSCFGSIKTLCFGIEAKQLKQTVSKQTETNRKNPKFSEKQYQYIVQTVSVGLLFVSVNQNIETLCFSIEMKQPKQTFCFG